MVDYFNHLLEVVTRIDKRNLSQFLFANRFCRDANGSFLRPSCGVNICFLK